MIAARLGVALVLTAFRAQWLAAGFCAITVAFESGEGAVILMNSDPDVDAVADALVKAIGRRYRWPGYPPP